MSANLHGARDPVRVILIANPQNRRATGFVDALARRGWPPPIMLAHRELIADPSLLAALDDTPSWVRIDACGEDAELERALLELGAEADIAEPRCERLSRAELAQLRPGFGQIIAPRQHHAGFLRYLDTLAAIVQARPHWRLTSPIEDIRALFDKRETSRRYAARGIPVPEPLPDMGAIETPEQLRAAMVAQRWPAVFVKVSCSSSASCLALYRHLPTRPADSRDRLLTTVATTPDGRFNSLRLQTLQARADVDALLQWLLDEGAQLERAVAKARLDARPFDLRVLVVAGQPAVVVVRQSRHPITNLHLGGTRGDLDALRAMVAPADWDAAMRSCQRVFECHGCLHVGVDLMFEPSLQAHRIIEANAFGDLLPGLGVYERQLDAMAAGWVPAP